MLKASILDINILFGKSTYMQTLNLYLKVCIEIEATHSVCKISEKAYLDTRPPLHAPLKPIHMRRTFWTRYKSYLRLD